MEAMEKLDQKIEQETNLQQQLNGLKQQLQQIIDVYNNLSTDEKLHLVDANKCKQEEKVDVSQYLICSYTATSESNHVTDSIGLFTEKTFHYEYSYKKAVPDIMFTRYKTVEGTMNNQIYTGVYGDLIAVRQADLGETGSFLDIGSRARHLSGEDGIIQVSCWIDKIFSFESVRQQMYQEGLIDSYEIGKATNEEILKVLGYAKEYFKNENADKKDAEQHNR